MNEQKQKSHTFVNDAMDALTKGGFDLGSLIALFDDGGIGIDSMIDGLITRYYRRSDNDAAHLGVSEMFLGNFPEFVKPLTRYTDLPNIVYMRDTADWSNEINAFDHIKGKLEQSVKRDRIVIIHLDLSADMLLGKDPRWFTRSAFFKDLKLFAAQRDVVIFIRPHNFRQGSLHSGNNAAVGHLHNAANFVFNTKVIKTTDDFAYKVLELVHAEAHGPHNFRRVILDQR